MALAIGARVRQERQSRRWTLDQLADAAGVSRRMVVNVEQGAANPSVGTLLQDQRRARRRAARAGRAASPRPVKVTRRGDGAALWSGESGGRGVLVAGTEPPDVVELWDWTLGPGRPARSEAHTPGTKELLQVQRGHDHASRSPASRVTLDAGDAVAFPGDVAHSYANPGTEPAQVLPGRLRAGRGTGSTAGGRRCLTPACLRNSSTAAGLTPPCSRCGPTTARCCWPSTDSSRARATRPARSCCRRRRPPPARRSATSRSSSSRTWLRGGRPTGPSGPSRSAPATASRRCCAGRRPGCPA